MIYVSFNQFFFLCRARASLRHSHCLEKASSDQNGHLKTYLQKQKNPAFERTQIKKNTIYIFIYKSSLCVYVSECLLDGCTDFNAIFCVIPEDSEKISIKKNWFDEFVLHRGTHFVLYEKRFYNKNTVIVIMNSFTSFILLTLYLTLHYKYLHIEYIKNIIDLNIYCSRYLLSLFMITVLYTTLYLLFTWFWSWTFSRYLSIFLW